MAAPHAGSRGHRDILAVVSRYWEPGFSQIDISSSYTTPEGALNTALPTLLAGAKIIGFLPIGALLFFLILYTLQQQQQTAVNAASKPGERRGKQHLGMQDVYHSRASQHQPQEGPPSSGEWQAQCGSPVVAFAWEKVVGSIVQQVRRQIAHNASTWLASLTVHLAACYCCSCHHLCVSCQHLQWVYDTWWSSLSPDIEFPAEVGVIPVCSANMLYAAVRACRY
jgi:hypothetical protein